MSSLNLVIATVIEGLENVGHFWEGMGDWEINFLYWLNSLHRPFINVIFLIITTLGDHGALWIASGVIMLFFKKTRKMGIYVCIAYALIGGANDFIFKKLFDRSRPFYQNTIDVYGDKAQTIQDSVVATFYGEGVFLGFMKIPSNRSFFSGHSVASMACAVMILFHNKKFGIPAIILAFLIGFSRLWFGVHWPTDVIFGFLFAAVAAVGLYFLLRFLEPKVIALFKKIFKKEKEVPAQE